MQPHHLTRIQGKMYYGFGTTLYATQAFVFIIVDVPPATKLYKPSEFVCISHVDWFEITTVQ